MKAIKKLTIVILVFITGNLMAQQKEEINFADSTGMPGDNFSLQAALETFKDAKSLEDFEKKLNSQNKEVNNLDLNGDGKIDYVKVIDIAKDDAHAIVLQVPISATESQDIAVIEIEKDGDKSAFVQIIGDEAIYGETTIVEPVENTEPADNGNSKRGPSAYSMGQPAFYVNIWFWPCVPVLFAPVYVPWVSPFYWGYYPGWWSPWTPYPWRYYHMNTWHYHHHYHYYPHYRSTYANQIYAPRRNSSAMVDNRYHGPRESYKANVNNRPRPGTPSNVNTGRPSKPGNANQGRPSTRPATQPTTQPSGRPQSKPTTQPTGRPQSKPSTQPAGRPQSKPTTQPAGRPHSKPTTQPPGRPKMHHESKSANQPSGRPSQPSRQGGRRPR